MKKRLIKKADTNNFHVIPDSVSINAINSENNFFDELIDMGFQRLHNANCGSFGCYAFTIDNNYEIQMFILEVHAFIMKNLSKNEKRLRKNSPECVVIEFKLDDHGNIIGNKIKKLSNYHPSEPENDIKNNDYYTETNGLQAYYSKSMSFEGALSDARSKQAELKKQTQIS